MELSTQEGSTTTNKMADVPGYCRLVWFHPVIIFSIIDLVNAKGNIGGLTIVATETSSKFTKVMAPYSYSNSLKTDCINSTPRKFMKMWHFLLWQNIISLSIIIETTIEF